MNSLEFNLSLLEKKINLIKRKYHTCEKLLPLKKRLEFTVKSILLENKDNKAFKKYFKKPFTKRKKNFYNKEIISVLMDGFRVTKSYIEFFENLWLIENEYIVKTTKIEDLESQRDSILEEIDLKDEKRNEMIEYLED